MAAFNSAAASKIQALLDEATSTGAVPGVIVRAVDAQNTVLFSSASGTVAAKGHPDKAHALADDNITQVWSCTKFVTPIALLQLCDRGLLSLDDATIIPRLLPELATKQVLTGFTDADPPEPVLVPREGDMTPRMLLTHTNGTGLIIFNAHLLQWLGPDFPAKLELNDYWGRMLGNPLVHQPGTAWHYGAGTDWAGVLIERLSGLPLQDYCQQNIFAPLGLRDIYFDAHMPPPTHPRVFPPYVKADKGGVSPPVLHPADEQHAGPGAEAKGPFFPHSDEHRYMGAAGLASSAPDFCSLLAAVLLNGGVDATSGHRLLSSESADAFFQPQLPPGTTFDGKVESMVPFCHSADLRVEELGMDVGVGGNALQGRDLLLPDGRPGRRAGSTYWYGFKNAEWWVDRKTGVAVTVISHYLPWLDPAWSKLVGDVEAELYAGLEESGK